MYALSWHTIYVLTGVLVWYLLYLLLCNSGNIHQNNTLMSAQTFCHLSSYIILYTKHPLNSLAPGRFQFNFRQVILKLIWVNGSWGISYEIALRWLPLDFTDDKSTLVQLMAWCCQATSHYLSQSWPRSMTPNGVTRPQWVNHKSTTIEMMTFCQSHVHYQ